MNQTIEDLKRRWSIRKFKDEQITDEELNTILEAGNMRLQLKALKTKKLL